MHGSRRAALRAPHRRAPGHQEIACRSRSCVEAVPLLFCHRQSIKGRRGRLLRLRVGSRPSITASWHKRQSLFYLVQPLGLIEVFARDRNWSEKRYLLFRLLAFTEKPYQRVERPAYLAAGQLLDCGGSAASPYLAPPLRQHAAPRPPPLTEEAFPPPALPRRPAPVLGPRDQ